MRENGTKKGHAYKKGEKNPNAKIREADVTIILSLRYNAKWSYRHIAQFAQVHKLAVHNICTGKTWNDQYRRFFGLSLRVVYSRSA
jgi:hypothetical protein